MSSTLAFVGLSEPSLMQTLFHLKVHVHKYEIIYSFPIVDRPVYTNPPSQMQCPDDEHPWVAFGVYCYLFFPEAKLSLAEADLECQQLDSGLLSLHSPDVNNWVTTHMVAPVWLGLIKQRSGNALQY